MLWQVRALLPDRPGAMAALADRCGALGANILALDVHPSADGEVVDELVLHTPGGWSTHDVERLCTEAGVFDSAVSECSAHALEDQPVRYLRAAQVVVRDPDQLEDQLCRMLDAQPADDHDSAALLLDDDAGPVVAIDRARPLTPTEQARATELRMVAAAARERDHHPAPDAATPAVVPTPAPAPAKARVRALAEPGTLREGTVVDIRPLVEMHERCSAETLSRRYHSPVRRLSARVARAMLMPDDGFSLVLPDGTGDGLVATGMATFQDDGVVEAALLVEDGWQRRGHGTALLRALAAEAASRGARDLTLVTRRDDGAVLRTVHRAGFRAHVTRSQGVTTLRVPLVELSVRRTADRVGRRRVTEPLVALLHQRQELREVYAPADIIDRAVRDGV